MEKLIANIWLILGVILFTVAVVISENTVPGIINLKTIIVGSLSLACFVTGGIKIYTLNSENTSK